MTPSAYAVRCGHVTLCWLLNLVYRLRLVRPFVQAAYMKILESSQTLLHVLKRETVNLTKKKQAST